MDTHYSSLTQKNHRLCVFRVKENIDGSLNKYKARLVEKVFHQQYGFEFHETFSPIVKPTTIRVILTLALTYKWYIQQVDLNNAFSMLHFKKKYTCNNHQGLNMPANL